LGINKYFGYYCTARCGIMTQWFRSDKTEEPDRCIGYHQQRQQFNEIEHNKPR